MNVDVVDNLDEILSPEDNMIVQLFSTGKYYKYSLISEEWKEVFKNYKLKNKIINDFNSIIRKLELGYSNIDCNNLINTILYIESGIEDPRIIEYLFNYE